MCSNFGNTSIKSHFESYFSNFFLSKNRPKNFPGAFGARTLAYQGEGVQPKSQSLTPKKPLSHPPPRGRVGQVLKRGMVWTAEGGTPRWRYPMCPKKVRRWIVCLNIGIEKRCPSLLH